MTVFHNSYKDVDIKAGMTSGGTTVAGLPLKCDSARGGSLTPTGFALREPLVTGWPK
jgi:hypothetical protein